MRKLFMLLLVAVISLSSTAQKRIADSLEQLLKTEKRDTTRARLVSRLAVANINHNPDTALYLAQQSLEYGKANNNDTIAALSLNVIATIYLNIGNYAKSLELYLQALKKFESANDLSRLAVTMHNIATIYSELGDERKSLEFSIKGKALAEKLQRDPLIASFTLNIGDSYEKLDVLDSARIYTTTALELSKKINNAQVLGLSYCNLGNINLKSGEHEIALSYYRKALSVTTGQDEYVALCEVTLGMAKVFQKMGINDSSLYYARFSANTSRDLGYTPALLNASIFLSDYYKKQKNADSAFVYMENIIAAKDSLFSEAKNQQVQGLLFDEATRQQQVENEKLQAKKTRDQNIQYAIIAITVLSFVVIFSVLSRSVMVNEKWIHFLGILGLLLVFEFINLVLHPVLADITHHSPVWMLVIMVGIAALLIPLHHRLEHFIRHKLTAKNKKIRLEAAKKTVAKLEKEAELSTVQNLDNPG